MPRSRPHRIVFYIDDNQNEALPAAIEQSGLERSDWLRKATADAASAPDRAAQGNREASRDLAAAQERIRGLEELLQQARERQGMSDSLNLELNERLEQALTTVDGFRLMLPAPRRERVWWKLW